MELKIRVYESSDELRVIQLWHDCGLVVPQNDPQRDIALKVAFQPELFLVGCIDQQVIASIMAGYEGHRGWLNYLAVSPQYRGHGFGRQIVEAATNRLEELGCPKVNLQIRTSNAGVIQFYQIIGFTIDDAVSMGKRL